MTHLCEEDFTIFGAATYLSLGVPSMIATRPRVEVRQ